MALRGSGGPLELALARPCGPRTSVPSRGAAGGRKFFDGDGYRQIAKKIAAFLVSGVWYSMHYLSKIFFKKRKVWELGVRPTKETHEQTAGQATNRRSAAAFSLRNRF